VNASDYIVVITTCSNEDEAERITSELVGKRLAACVQSEFVQSTYQWQGKIETTQEVRLMIKAKLSDYGAIEAAIKTDHAYENPEVIAIPMVAGSESYLGWISDETVGNG